MGFVNDSLRSVRMSSIMQSNPIAAAQASASTGSVFRNLMNASPPPPPPPPPVEREHKPVRPSVEVMQAGVEPTAAPSVETNVEAVSTGVESGMKVHDQSVPEKKGVRRPMFTANDLRRNFVMTEILGKPVALRRK